MGLPLNTIIEVAIVGDLFGQTTMNVWHYRVSTLSTTVNPLTEVRDFITQHFSSNISEIGGVYEALAPNEWFGTRTTGQAIYPTRQRRVTVANILQGVSGPTTTPNVQASITYQSVLAGRDQIGGKRFPMPTSKSSNGLVTAAYKAQLDNMGIATIAPQQTTIGGGIYTPVIYHRSPTAPVAYNDVQAYVAQDQTRVIRRRTVGLGI